MDTRRKKILLIDDEADLCYLMKMNLEFDGLYDVETATSGEDGVKKALANNFDLIITDFRMPGMSGKEVVDRLKEQRPAYPIIIFSIYHDDSITITRDLRNKVDGIISKPIDHSQLTKTIIDALAISRRSKGN